MDNSIKRELLHVVYETYASYIENINIDFACTKGCASCCTQSVTMTALEGCHILDFINAGKAKFEKQQLLEKLSAAPSPETPRYTTNQLAAHFLEAKEPDDQERSRQYEPCIFLNNSKCSIYPARPFGCRSFASILHCDSEGTAELPSALISLHTAIMQIIEHIDQGQCWGNMIEIIRLLAYEGREGRADNKADSPALPVSQANRGFLVPPEDRKQISPCLATLFKTRIKDRSFGEWQQNP